MLISVITVVRNDPAAAATVCSVLSQKGVAAECVVIDGASTDGTLRALAPYRRRIHLVSEADHGIYDGMNKGLGIAKGKVVGFLNAGDTFVGPHALKAVVEAFSDDKLLGASWAGLEIRDKRNRLKRYWPPQPFVPGAFSHGWMPSHPTFYSLRSQLLKLKGFDTRYRLAADYDLMLRALEVQCLRGRALPLTLVRMRSGGASQASWFALLRHNREAWTAALEAGITEDPFLIFLAKKMAHKLPQLF